MRTGLKTVSVITVIVLINFATGCASLGRYMKDRGSDFLDCFKLEAGIGLLADVEVRATDLISTGTGFSISKKWGLDGRRPSGFGEFGKIDTHIGLPFSPLLWIFESEHHPMNPFVYDGSIRFFYTDFNIREGAFAHLNISSREPLGTPVDICDCRDSHKSILFFDITAFRQYRDYENVEILDECCSCGGSHKVSVSNPRKLIDAFDVEVGATMLLSVRAGFSPGQFLDFLLGWFGFDIGDDDDKARKQELLKAVRKEDIEKVKKLIASGVDVNTGVVESTILHAAIGNLELMKLLIENGANVNKKNVRGDIPLHYVQDTKIARFLLSRGADVNARNNEGKTPLHYAEKEAAIVLIEKGANINARDDDGYTPLYMASCQDNLEKAKILLDLGADPDIQSNTGNVAAHEAVRHDYRAIIELLISRGADINVKNKRGKTPLSHVYDNNELIEYLKNHGAVSGEELKEK